MFFNLAAAAPLTVAAGVIPTAYAVTGLTGLPVAFLAVAAGLALFAVGFVAMARRVSNAGAFYAYIARGLGRPFGVGAAWVAVVAYNAMQVGLYGLVGAATAPVVEQWFGVPLPWWLIALACWALVAVLGVLRVDVNGRILAALLCAEVIVLAVYHAANLTHPADGTLALGALSPTNLAGGGVGALLVLAILGFVGFEGAVVFSEESRDRQRTVAVATYVSIGVIAVLYAVSSWAMTVAAGPDQIITRAQADGPELLFNLANANLGAFAADTGHALFATSVVAAAISFHNTSARYVFALGREGVLPHAFGRTNAAGAPRAGSLCQSLLGLTVIVVYAVGGWDPVANLFFWAGTAGGLGVLLLIAAASVAIAVFLGRQPDGEGWWTGRTAPILAAVLMVAAAGLGVVQFDVVLGSAPAWLPIAVPLFYLFVTLLGVGYGLALRASHSAVYPRIGLGAHASLAVPPVPRQQQRHIPTHCATDKAAHR
nr:APC family permease [Pilimelia anulata]